MRQVQTREIQECIEECQECHRVCLETVDHCLQLGGRHAEAGHIKSLLACADACRISGDFMMLGSELHPETCGVCALACDACAESCDAIGGGDEQMARCAEVCRRCAESCRSMASAR